jgi:hypothetical protein
VRKYANEFAAPRRAASVGSAGDDVADPLIDAADPRPRRRVMGDDAGLARAAQTRREAEKSAGADIAA